MNYIEYCPENDSRCVRCNRRLGMGYFSRPVPELRYDLTGATFSALLRANQSTAHREDLYAGLTSREADALREAYFELTSEKTAHRLGWMGGEGE